MARLARVVAPGVPHHVTQRGNRRQRTFFCEAGYGMHAALLGEQGRARGVAVGAWCLMPNHVHLILVPAEATALAAALGETHRRYTQAINRRGIARVRPCILAYVEKWLTRPTFRASTAL